MLVAQIKGKGCDALFANEPGGHRWQRIPPNDKHGRVHTSTVTVAVMPEPTQTEFVLQERDLEISATRGSGAGGQKRNKTSNCIIVKHVPSGLQVRCESERSQSQNKQSALELLAARLWEAKHTANSQALVQQRRTQVGSGMRGDKRRTIRTQDGQVNDHITGRRWELKAYLRGDW